ncbi:YbaB/EbfC family nucleoid-associated protein [Deferribacterales bacterium RsTz2092]
MQKRLADAQEEVANEIVTASTGGGMVKVEMNGRQELVSLTIKKEIVDPEDVEMLQDLVLAAINESVRMSHSLMQDKMKELTGGLNIPGLF